jgi:hypothetical protein
MIGVIGHLIVFGGGYLASFVFPNHDAASRELTLWGYLHKPTYEPTTTCN